MIEKRQITPRITTLDDIVNRDLRFRYMLLSRLQSDCDYYLNYGNRFPGCLWAGNEQKQIEVMIKLHESFDEDEKPEWLTMEEILEYDKKMKTPSPVSDDNAVVLTVKLILTSQILIALSGGLMVENCMVKVRKKSISYMICFKKMALIGLNRKQLVVQLGN